MALKAGSGQVLIKQISGKTTEYAAGATQSSPSDLLERT